VTETLTYRDRESWVEVGLEAIGATIMIVGVLAAVVLIVTAAPAQDRSLGVAALLAAGTIFASATVGGTIYALGAIIGILLDIRANTLLMAIDPDQ